jgi:hypothetical protein
MHVVMSKFFHQCQRGRLLDSWFGQLVVIDVNPWRVILDIDVNPWRVILDIDVNPWRVILDIDVNP